jgi:uncharacterized protein YaiI (UPF0178 family)
MPIIDVVDFVMQVNRTANLDIFMVRDIALAKSWIESCKLVIVFQYLSMDNTSDPN